MTKKDEERASRFCRENAIDYGDSVIEGPLAEEFAKIRAEAYAAATAECERIAKERHARYHEAILSGLQCVRPEVKMLPEHYRNMVCEGTVAAEECAEAIKALKGGAS